MRMSTIISTLACALLLLLLVPVSMLSNDAYGITNPIVSQSIKNINGKTTQLINTCQQAMLSVKILNYDIVEQPFTAIVDVESSTSVYIE